MGCGYVERGEVGFWANNDYLWQLMRGMVGAVNVLPDAPAWLREARAEWQRELDWKKTVSVVLDLDPFATSSDRIATL